MRAFVKEVDLKIINGWLKSHALEEMLEDDLPRIGSIIDGVACGFLVGTDCSTCFLDAFITNPEASSADRDKALHKISKWLINLAQTCGYRRVIVLSKTQSILERARDLGFKMNGTSVLALEL